MYAVHPLTAAIARRLVTVDAIALPNVLARRRIVPEHVQELDPARIARDALAVVGERDQVPYELIEALDGPRALDRTADEVAGWLGAA